jgi:hypothetical protein
MRGTDGKIKLFRVTREEFFTTETQSSQSSEIILIKKFLFRALCASALKIVADPSCGGSAVQSPSAAPQESLKMEKLKRSPTMRLILALVPVQTGATRTATVPCWI